MRTSQCFLLAGLVALALAGVARVVGLSPQEPTLEGTVNIDYGRPVPLDGAAQKQLNARDASFGGACGEHRRVVKMPEYAPLLDAVASTRCRRSSVGARTITSYRFETAGELAALYGVFRRSQLGAKGGCDGSTGISSWAKRDGELAGKILCYYGSGADFVVLWTEDATKTLHIAKGRDTAELLEWWQRAVRPQKQYPSKAERDLLDLIRPRVDAKTCSRDDSGGSPMARAAIKCRAVGTRDSAGVFFELHTPGNLDRYLSDLFADPSLQDIAQVDAPCRSRSLQRGSWQTPGRGTRGTLACFPRGARVLIWTIDAAGLYGYLEGEGLTTPNRLYGIWKERLRGIGS